MAHHLVFAAAISADTGHIIRHYVAIFHGDDARVEDTQRDR